jgi:UDP-glucose 4-epimerase
MGKKILVTGGAGYIGSHMLLELRQKGFDPIVFDNLSSGCREAVGEAPLFIGDLLNKIDLENVFSTHSFSGVIHFAALTEVEKSVKNPHDFYVQNVQGSLNLLESMRQFGVSNLIFSSTAAVYGDSPEIMVKEEAPLNPKNPYGMSKLMVEKIIQDYEKAYGLRATILRYFNAAGCDPQKRTGIYQKKPTLLIPVAVKTALGQLASFTLFGNDYHTVDGTCVRDFIHVQDLCSAHLEALERLFKGESGDVYNLGQGYGTTVREVLDTVIDISGQQFTVIEGARREGDIGALVADISKAKRELQWEPKRSSIRELVQDTLNWYS